MKTAFATTRLAHAKLNVRLEVGPKTGPLHAVMSVIAPLELADEIQFAPSPGGFSVSCEGAVIAERDNLAWRAAQAFGSPVPEVAITIRKRIPLQAGLGGGSADAAQTLETLAQLLRGLEHPPGSDAIAKAAIDLGSDVPASLVPGLKIVSGVGDRVTPYSTSAPPWGIVLLKAATGSDTARAYALLDARGPRPALGEQQLERARAACAAFASHDFNGFVDLVHNDFTDPIESALPEVASARRRLDEIGARKTLLCGSGSCVAGFFEDLEQAQSGHAKLTLSEGDWSTVTRFHV